METIKDYLSRPRTYIVVLLILIVLGLATLIVVGIANYGGTRQAQMPMDEDSQLQTQPCGRYGYAQQATSPQMRCQ